jgi:hypothetical protein
LNVGIGTEAAQYNSENIGYEFAVYFIYSVSVRILFNETLMKDTSSFCLAGSAFECILCFFTFIDFVKSQRFDSLTD